MPTMDPFPTRASPLSSWLNLMGPHRVWTRGESECFSFLVCTPGLSGQPLRRTGPPRPLEHSTHRDFWSTRRGSPRLARRTLPDRKAGSSVLLGDIGSNDAGEDVPAGGLARRQAKAALTQQHAPGPRAHGGQSPRACPRRRWRRGCGGRSSRPSPGRTTRHRPGSSGCRLRWRRLSSRTTGAFGAGTAWGLSGWLVRPRLLTSGYAQIPPQVNGTAWAVDGGWVELHEVRQQPPVTPEEGPIALPVPPGGGRWISPTHWQRRRHLGPVPIVVPPGVSQHQQQEAHLNWRIVELAFRSSDGLDRSSGHPRRGCCRRRCPPGFLAVPGIGARPPRHAKRKGTRKGVPCSCLWVTGRLWPG